MKHDIRFLSEGKTLAGHLYIPDGIQPDDRLPAVVVAAPGSGIKEQTAGIYAEALSRRGIVALAFDHRTYGESEGYPRFLEDPYAKARKRVVEGKSVSVRVDLGGRRRNKKKKKKKH